MDFNFNWNFIATGVPYITISGTGISCNQSLAEILGKPEEVQIGFDESEMAIGIMPKNDNIAARSHKFSSRQKNGWIRIGCKDFVRYLAVRFNLDFGKAKRFVAQYDKEKNLAYVIIRPENGGDE